MLTNLFNENKLRLSESLKGLTMPKDSEKIQHVISTFFSELLLEEGDFRQSLTQSEDYILEAVLSILKAQQAQFECLPSPEIRIENSEKSSISYDKNKKASGITIKEASPSIAAGFGALAGGVLLGTWGAVCGAIACTALTTYTVSHNLNRPTVQEEVLDKNTQDKIRQPEEKPLDVSNIVSVIYNLCKSIDDIIATFRAQINKVIQKYENIEKPSFEQEHATLLDSVQTLVGYARGHSDDDKFVKKIQERVEDLAESLENYNLVLVDYDENNIGWFESVPSSKTADIKQVYPAVAKEGVLVKKGKVFIPEN